MINFIPSLWKLRKKVQVNFNYKSDAIITEIKILSSWLKNNLWRIFFNNLRSNKYLLPKIFNAIIWNLFVDHIYRNSNWDTQKWIYFALHMWIAIVIKVPRLKDSFSVIVNTYDVAKTDFKCILTLYINSTETLRTSHSWESIT